MSDPKRKERGRSARENAASVRRGGALLRIRNSGLEVWLYDDANRERIRQPHGTDEGFGGMPRRLDEQTSRGLVVGYSLLQDDDLHVAVYVGPPLSDAELEVARWLEPQHARLQLPSGRLCVESNDASRIGPEEPTEAGAIVEVPPGSYRLTLYRIDHEALDREGLSWQGAQELIVLTPGGSEADAASNLLPFEPRRDDAWIGRYSIRNGAAEALVWFGDYWDTFIVNLDAAAVQTLDLAPGAYLRTHVPAAGLSLVTVYGESWEQARRLPPPADFALEEYGYGALNPMADWGGAQALFCRRERARTRIEDEHLKTWMPATVEVLAAQPAARARAGQLLSPTELRTRLSYEPWFLGEVLSEVLPEVAELEELELQDALDRLDRKLARQGLRPQGDLAWADRVGASSTEYSCRLCTGLPDGFAAIIGAAGMFMVVYLTELEDGSWIVTGLADDLERRLQSRDSTGLPVPHPRVRLTSMDESLAKIFAAHRRSLRRENTAPAPMDREQAVAAWERFPTVGFGTQLS